MLLAGCAGYEMAPLAANHPAHPEAPVTPELAPSQTLAYSRADIPSVQPVSPVMAAPHEGHASRQSEASASTTVVGEGEVIATVPNASQLVLEHGELKGFMEAMTMGYRVDPASLLAALQPGDKVRFTIDVQRRAIVRIEKLQ
jgi:Cu/Ag efflux protein CusF